MQLYEEFKNDIGWNYAYSNSYGGEDHRSYLQGKYEVKSTQLLSQVNKLGLTRERLTKLVSDLTSSGP